MSVSARLPDRPQLHPCRDCGRCQSSQGDTTVLDVVRRSSFTCAGARRAACKGARVETGRRGGSRAAREPDETAPTPKAKGGAPARGAPRAAVGSARQRHPPSGAGCSRAMDTANEANNRTIGSPYRVVLPTLRTRPTRRTIYYPGGLRGMSGGPRQAPPPPQRRHHPPARPLTGNVTLVHGRACRRGDGSNICGGRPPRGDL